MLPGTARCQSRAVSFILLSALCALGVAQPGTASATPTMRFQIDVKGDILLVGNTLGQECRVMDLRGLPVPKPVVGTVGNCGDPLTIDDSAPDVLWNSDYPAPGMVTGDNTIMNDQARSTAMLNLPTGSQVVYARLYWGGNLAEDITLAASQILFERAGTGGFSMMLTPDAKKNEIGTALGGGGGHMYQSTVDVTGLVQKYGSGSYRVGNVVRRSVIDRDEDVQYDAWALVVVYNDNTQPVRNITVWDGITGVDIGQSVNMNISGFAVPTTNSPQAKLAVVAYEGDSDKSDSLLFNGQALTDAQNPSDNFFNSTRSTLGMPVSVVGDLPQLMGTMASMSGLDMDIVDISSLVKPGDTSATVLATSVDDVYYVGALVTSIVSLKPILQTTLIANPSSVKPGDTITFTSTTVNIGNDNATGVVIHHPLPQGLTYVPGSIKFVSGPDQSQNGPKTDQPGDDQAELSTDPMTGNPVLVFRIGKGANGSMGGTVAPTDPPIVVTYQLKAAPTATGAIPTQSTTTGVPASNPTVPPTTFPSGNGMLPNAPTVVYVPGVVADLRITVTKTPPNAQPGQPTTYDVDVSNVGNTTDPGPIHVVFNVPPGGTINSVTPGAGWTCTQANRTIYCTSTSPLPPGNTTRAVEVVLTEATPPTMGNDANANVYSDGAVDPNPADNSWDELTGGAGGTTRIAGGGIGCSLDPGAGASGLGALSAAAMALLALARRRPRKTERSSRTR